MIKIWNAFSCNNSSSFRVVALFTDASTVLEVAAELGALLTAHADPDGEISPMQALATQYGFDWPNAEWGGPDDAPDVIAAGDYLIVYHAHCLGLGPGLPTYLESRGGLVEPERNMTDIQMSVMFRATPGLDRLLDEELAEMFDQPVGKSIGPLRAPWSFEHDSYGTAAFFRDAGTVGLYFPTEPRDILAVKAWLAEHGIEKVVMRFDEPTDEKLFAKLAAARCTACNGILEYLDPRLHDIDTPQLVCTPCGGLYELAVFMPWTIRIWNAFASNNSSSYRLIARFADLHVARETAAEVALFLIDNARQGHGDWIETQAATDLAARYGFTWTDLLDWSPHLHRGDEPQVAIDGGTVVLFHRYCQGFGDLSRFFEAKGATVEADCHAPTISALFRSTPGTNPLLDAELAALFEDIEKIPTKAWQPFRSPWPTQHNTYGEGTAFRDAGTVGLCVPLAPRDLSTFQHWLASRDIAQPSLRWSEHGDAALFSAIAKARCTACSGALEYLDPRLHDIESPQLVCRPCGGLYELSALFSV